MRLWDLPRGDYCVNYGKEDVEDIKYEEIMPGAETNL